MKGLKEEDINFTVLYILQQLPEMRTDEQLQLVAELFRSKRYLANITDFDTIMHICKRVYVESYHRNQVIFYKGQKGDYFYIILNGLVGGCQDDDAFQLDYKQPYVFTLGPDSSFGEMAILTNTQRMCTVKAIESTDLIVIPKEVYLQYSGVISSGNQRQVCPADRKVTQ